MHLIELAWAIQADRERALRRGWRSEWWAALRHPRADKARQLEDVLTGASGSVQLAVLPGR